MMRAKLRVSHADPLAEGQESQNLTFLAVAASHYPDDGTDENNTFARWTPNAVLQITICNPELIGKFAIGDEFYVDFTKVATPE
ncbi:MAG TPA: hypothetical protein VFG73_02160 [Rhodanobacteraceae bacterium]|nr:hypothetical protein [Rhodanobacteraceae bacterium]